METLKIDRDQASKLHIGVTKFQLKELEIKHVLVEGIIEW